MNEISSGAIVRTAAAWSRRRAWWPRISGLMSTDIMPLFAIVLLASAAILALLAFVVLVSMTRMDSGAIVGFSGFDNYLSLFSAGPLPSAIANTAQYAGITLFVAFGFGVPLAWLVERTNLPGRTLVWTGMLASLLIPKFLIGMGWIFLAHPRIGLINAVLVHWLDLEEAPFPVTGVAGMGWVEGLALGPFVFILIGPSMRNIDAALEEAGCVSGASFLAIMRRISLPLLYPGLAASLIYVLISAVGAFDIPAIIGMSNRIYVFSTLMYVLANPSLGFPDYPAIAATGGIMLLAALLLSLLYVQMLKKARRFEVVTGKARRPTRIALGLWTGPALLFAVFYIGCVLVFPCLMTLFMAFLPYAQPLSLEVLEKLSFANFGRIPWDLVVRGAIHTAELVAVVPILVVGISLSFSWIVLRTRLPGRHVFDTIAFLPHAVPSILFAIGAMLMALFFLQGIVPIYGTMGLVMLVYTVAWISIGTRIINSSLIQIHPELEEAAQLGGAGLSQILRRIMMPLLRPATSGLAILIVLMCLRELTLVAFVSTPQNITLPLVSWILWMNGNLNLAAAVALVVLASVTPVLLVFLMIRDRDGAIF